MTGATAKSGYLASAEKDPYKYQPGFGNSFTSESWSSPEPKPSSEDQIRLVQRGLLVGRSLRRALRTSKLGCTVFSHPSLMPGSPWLVSDFTNANPHIHINPTQVAWAPRELPADHEKIDFIDGLKTLGGTGSTLLREGIASHTYAANLSMERKAFVNSDGDILIFPDTGRLHTQTEMGNEIHYLVVIPGGIKFKVSLPDGPSRGFVQEVYGTQFVLPEQGPLGTSSLANVRDFEHPVASFDVDQSNWEIVYKLGGKLFTCKQDHTPFDVVAWTGNYAPYKYAMEKFILVRNANKDHTDPSTFRVLTAKSRLPSQPLLEIGVIVPHWDVGDSYRGPDFHRNTAPELSGVIYTPKDKPWREGAVPGGLNYYSGFVPHGSPAEEYKIGVETPKDPIRMFEDSYLFIVEPAYNLLLTDWL
ncbi:unnamed protein product [Somion occarium]|uniref:homogentisate 1,2-dioxygenase n=1 Tax=Somion occarium TaxID=3059160 RepID=A0ABP1E7Y3_9APHY